MAPQEPVYTPLDGGSYADRPRTPTRMYISNTMKDILIVLLALSTAISSISAFNKRYMPTQENFGYPALDLVSGLHIQNYTWWSGYSSTSHAIQQSVDQLWEEIVPAHGIVAVDHSWASEKELPQSISLPDDPSKGVYVIDAYHQLHCLKIVRKTFYELARGEKSTYPIGHSTHCFDNFRQYIQCTAGDTLLYSWGLNTTGDGQLRKCRDWSALSDWAGKHSACYRDGEPSSLLDHFGHCEVARADGLKV